MTHKTSNSSNSLPSPAPGATDSPWQPSWWHWLISALSGTVEIERQNALGKQRLNERDQRLNERDQRLNERDQRLNELKKSNAELRSKNEQLAELESKIDGLFSKYGISSTPANKPEQP